MVNLKCKFKWCSSMRQYLQLKPIKQRFKWWVRCASSKSYLFESCLWQKVILITFLIA